VATVKMLWQKVGATPEEATCLALAGGADKATAVSEALGSDQQTPAALKCMDATRLRSLAEALIPILVGAASTTTTASN
jgi:hypothetical protein